MDEHSISAEDQQVIKSILVGYREEGVEKPLLPMDVDLNGDGLVDSYGLDEHDNVVIVLGVPLEATVYISNGDDVTPGV